MPHCGDYHTRYDQIFAGRSSAEAQQLAALLPLRYSELKDACAAVTRAEEWLNTTASRDASDGVETVRALELLALRRRAFVQIARDYNRRIARYTELSTPGQVGSERLIGMLIKRIGHRNRHAAGSAPVRTTDNRKPRQLAEDVRRRMGAGEWLRRSATRELDEAIQQTSGETEKAADEPPRQERSLLVKPAVSALTARRFAHSAPIIVFYGPSRRHATDCAIATRTTRRLTSPRRCRSSVRSGSARC